jgi:DNA polymerase-1
MSILYTIDGNSIAHANHNANVLSVGDFQVQAIFGFLKSLRALMARAPHGSSVMVLWDGKAQFRKAIYPDYKGNREDLDAEAAKHRAAFDRQMPFLEKMLETLGVRQIRCPYLEADDLAAFFVNLLPGRRITLVSGDRDWIQLVGPDVEWFDPIRDRKVTHDTFLEKTGYFDVDAFVQGKALQGDNSDNCPGIVGLGEKTAQLMLAEWKDMNRFFQAVADGKHTPQARKDKKAKTLHPEQLLASADGYDLFLRNVELMDLRRAPPPKPGDLIIKQKPANAAAFEALCERLNFVSILRERHGFYRDLGITMPAPAAADVPPWEVAA